MSADWLERLRAATERDGRKLAIISRAASEASQAAGGPPISDSYVSELLREKMDPTIGRLTAVCEALGVSTTYILSGVAISPEVERVISELANVSDAERARLVRQFPGSSPAPDGGEPQPPEQSAPHSTRRTARSGHRR